MLSVFLYPLNSFEFSPCVCARSVVIRDQSISHFTILNYIYYFTLNQYRTSEPVCNRFNRTAFYLHHWFSCTYTVKNCFILRNKFRQQPCRNHILEFRKITKELYSTTIQLFENNGTKIIKNFRHLTELFRKRRAKCSVSLRKSGKVFRQVLPEYLYMFRKYKE